MRFEGKKEELRSSDSHFNVLFTTPYCAFSWQKWCQVKMDLAGTWGLTEVLETSTRKAKGEELQVREVV